MKSTQNKAKIAKVSSLLGVNARKSKITYDAATDTYTIQPKNSKESLELESLNLERLHLYSLCFCRCRFTQPLEFKGEATKKKSIKSLVFEECTFEQSVNFSYCEFEEFICKYAKFRENVYFESAQFKRLELCNSKFSQVSFCNAVFLNPPKIYDNQFEKHANFSGARCEKSLDELKEFIQQECKKENITGKNDTQQNIRKREIFNQYSESFRICKSALIASDNLLDASKYHKYELYLKEIELDKDIKSAIANTGGEEKSRRISRYYRDLIEKIILHFYRSLCDHHTDTLKVCNNFILLLALFSIFLFFSDFYTTVIAWAKDKDTHFLKDFIVKIISMDTFFTTIDFLIVFLILGAITYAISTLVSIKKEMGIFFKQSCLFLYYLFRAGFIGVGLFCITVGFLHNFIKVIPVVQTIIVFSVSLLFSACYILLIINTSKIFRIFLIVLAYGICAIEFTQNKFFLPMFNIITESNTSNNTSTNEIPVALFMSYLVFVLLVIFSLQKTARKNSIIPK